MLCAGLQAFGLHLLCAAVAGLGALLLPAEQDRGLVGLLRIAVATRLALLLPFVLFARAALLLAVLGARMIELGGGSFALGGARIGIVLPRSAVTMQPAPIEFDDLLHVRQQLAIMTDHQQATAPLLQLLVQLLAMACIEVVAGFVQDQPIGTAGPGTGQRDLHGLATTEARGRLGGIEIVGQPKRLPLLLQAFAQVPAVADAGEVGLVHAAGFDALQCGQFRADAGQFTDRAGGWIAGRRQQEHAATAAHLASVGQQPSGQQACEHALASAIGTDQAGGDRFEGKRQIGKQRAAVGQSIRHAIEREGMRSHATSMDAGFSPARRGGKSQAVWWEDGGINGALVASLWEE